MGKLIAVWGAPSSGKTAFSVKLAEALYLCRVMCLKDLEDYDKALELLDFISGLSDEIAEVHTLRANIYTIQGRKSLADEELQKAYSIKPELNPERESGGN